VRGLRQEGKHRIPDPNVPITSMFLGGGQEGSLRSG